MFDTVEGIIRAAWLNHEDHPSPPQRPGTRRRPPWPTTNGARSDTRWPHLTALNWLLPRTDSEESAIAAGNSLEDPWNLGYRGLLPKAVARWLAPPTATRGTEGMPFEEERAYLRQIERQRRKTLSHRILPDPRAVGAVPIDLCAGAP